jgi:hypothetical protein
MSYGLIFAVTGLAAWAVTMHFFYMPRFRRFVVALKAADPSTWVAIGSPDGTMFGSPITPAWGFRMINYLWRKQYEHVDNDDLRRAAEALRPVMISAQIGMLVGMSVWTAIVILVGRGTP